MNNSINKKDILLEIYNENELKPEKLKSLINDNHYDLYISSSLIKLLIKENEMELLKIIFDNLNLYDNEFIKWLLLLYKNTTFISTKNLNHEISKDKYKIIIDYEKKNNFYYRLRYRKTYKIENMNKNLIYYLVEHGIDINKDNMYKERPLFYACRSGNKDLLEYLVEHGANINKEHKNDETALFIACKSGDKNLVEYLVDHEADINKENKFNETPLFYACKSGNKDLIEYLVEHGADINKLNKDGETVLFIACKSGNMVLVEYLVEHGADINKVLKDDETVLFIACKSGNKNLVEY